MLYRPDGAPQPHKHQSLPLRVDQATINRVVEADEIKCTHFDAFRFFAADAVDKNRHALTRQTQLDHEQPACVHANMDLLRYALRLAPFVDAALIGDALDVALQARDLDIRASPYLFAGAAPWRCVKSQVSRWRQTFVNLNVIELPQLRGRRSRRWRGAPRNAISTQAGESRDHCRAKAERPTPSRGPRHRGTRQRPLAGCLRLLSHAPSRTLARRLLLRGDLLCMCFSRTRRFEPRAS